MVEFLPIFLEELPQVLSDIGFNIALTEKSREL